MKRNLELVASFIVLAIITFAVLLINRNEKQQEMQRAHVQEVMELRDTINKQQITINSLNAEVERQEEIIDMQVWQLRWLKPSDDR